MASAKELRKKIKSISNTKKITRTMEMVAASKSKKTTRRVEVTTPYSEKLRDLSRSLLAAGDVSHPLLGRAGDGAAMAQKAGEREALLVVTANRGLCGGYNTGVLHRAEKWVRAREAEGRTVDISMIGKKGISRFSFHGIPLRDAITDVGDWPSFEQAEAIARGFMTRYLTGEVSAVTVLSTRYHSASRQRPRVSRLLPIEPEEGETPAEGVKGGGGPGAASEFLFEPDAESILEALLPFSVCHALFRLLVEAAASEQIARQVAMKLATDNAEELTKVYTRMYNRQRQAGITRQIIEIMGGAQALE